MVTIKSRKHHKEIKIDTADPCARGCQFHSNFTCPKQKQRPRVCFAICIGRQEKRARGCTTCRIPQKVQRVLETAAKKKATPAPCVTHCETGRTGKCTTEKRNACKYYATAKGNEAEEKTEPPKTNTKGQAELW